MDLKCQWPALVFLMVLGWTQFYVKAELRWDQPSDVNQEALDPAHYPLLSAEWMSDVVAGEERRLIELGLRYFLDEDLPWSEFSGVQRYSSPNYSQPATSILWDFVRDLAQIDNVSFAENLAEVGLKVWSIRKARFAWSACHRNSMEEGVCTLPYVLEVHWRADHYSVQTLQFLEPNAHFFVFGTVQWNTEAQSLQDAEVSSVLTQAQAVSAKDRGIASRAARSEYFGGEARSQLENSKLHGVERWLSEVHHRNLLSLLWQIVWYNEVKLSEADAIVSALIEESIPYYLQHELGKQELFVQNARFVVAHMLERD